MQNPMLFVKIKVGIFSLGKIKTNMFNSKNKKIEVKLHALSIMQANNQDRIDTLKSIDTKIGILFGFYFLIFVNVLMYINLAVLPVKVIYVILFGLASYFLVKAFLMSRVKSLYPNVGNIIEDDEDMDEEYYLVYIEQRKMDYEEIWQALDKLIADRTNNFQQSVMFFAGSLIVATFYFVNM